MHNFGKKTWLFGLAAVTVLTLIITGNMLYMLSGARGAIELEQPPAVGVRTRPPASHRIVYFLHIHKHGGTSMCTAAKAVYGVPMVENCNVPTSWWQDEWTGYTDPKGNGGDGHQRASYFGNTVAGMTAIYNRLKEGSRKFAANEGTLEDAGLFPQDQRYTYVTMLRNPVATLISGYRFGRKSGYHSYSTFKSFLEGGVLLCEGFHDQCEVQDVNYNWMWQNPMTKKLCGYSCEPRNVRDDPLLQSRIQRAHRDADPESANTLRAQSSRVLVSEQYAVGKQHLDQAKRNLAKFDVVLFLSNFSEGLARLADVHKEWRGIKVPHKNQQGVAHKTVDEELAVPGVRELVDKVAGLDQELYAWSIKKFAK